MHLPRIYAKEVNDWYHHIEYAACYLICLMVLTSAPYAIFHLCL